MHRLERLLKENTFYHRGLAKAQMSSGSVDMLAAYPSMVVLFNDATSTAYDARYRCQHEPLFDDAALDRLIGALIDAQRSVLFSTLGLETMNALLGEIRRVVPTYGTASRERMVAAAGRDVVRTALCVALMSAVNVSMNSVVSTRSPAPKVQKPLAASPRVVVGRRRTRSL